MKKLTDIWLKADAQVRNANDKADPAFDSALRSTEKSKWTPTIISGIVASSFLCGLTLGAYLL